MALAADDPVLKTFWSRHKVPKPRQDHRSGAYISERCMPFASVAEFGELQNPASPPIKLLKK
ncbi:MAG: hypothetical protein JKX71_03275 [Amylibacter sp.]|nr:hypothetical protein [Amylibacter sp.]